MVTGMAASRERALLANLRTRADRCLTELRQASRDQAVS
jgi:hypothetical protein